MDECEVAFEVWLAEVEIFEEFDALFDDGVAGFALDIANETNPACIVFGGRFVETLFCWS